MINKDLGKLLSERISAGYGEECPRCKRPGYNLLQKNYCTYCAYFEDLPDTGQLVEYGNGGGTQGIRSEEI